MSPIDLPAELKPTFHFSGQYLPAVALQLQHFLSLRVLWLSRANVSMPVTRFLWLQRCRAFSATHILTNFCAVVLRVCHCPAEKQTVELNFKHHVSLYGAGEVCGNLSRNDAVVETWNSDFFG